MRKVTTLTGKNLPRLAVAKPGWPDSSGPVGFSFIEAAPRDGTFVRLRPRVKDGDGAALLQNNDEQIGHWQDHPEMKTGGAWFDRDGNYISPYPAFFATITPKTLADFTRVCDQTGLSEKLRK